MYSQIIEKIIDIENVLQKKRIIIFGTGKAGKLTFAALRSLLIEPSFFVDNNNEKWGQQLYNIQIHSPKEINKQLEEKYVLISSMYSGEISEQLNQMGLKEGIHYSVLISPVKRNGFKDAEITRMERFINGVKVGKYSYDISRLCHKGTFLESVGAFCSINVTSIVGITNHPTNYITTHPLMYEAQDVIADGVPLGLMDHYGKDVVKIRTIDKNKKIKIGNDVWIGARTIIMPGVTIGNGAIIGAGAIVTKDVPDYAVVTGVPAKVIKYRFSKEQINVLNRIQWWNWSDDIIAENYELLADPELFFQKFL